MEPGALKNISYSLSSREWMKKTDKPKSITGIRRVFQGAGLLAGLLGFAVPAMTHIIYPGLHCYACPLSVTICPVGIIQNLLKSGFPLFPLAFLGIYGILLGRWWCGWICPFGLVNDICIMLNTTQKKKQGIILGAGITCAGVTSLLFLFADNKWLTLIPGVLTVCILISLLVPHIAPVVKRKTGSLRLTGIFFLVFACFFPVVLFTEKGNIPVLITGAGFFLLVLAGGMAFFFKQKKNFIFKFIILVLTIGLAVIAADTLFCKLCPSAALSAALPYLGTNPDFVPGVMFWIKTGLLLFIIFCLVFVSRFFCRYLCPLGALFGIANKVSLLKIVRDRACDTADKSVCKYECLKVCIMGIKDIHKQYVLTQTDCIKCGRCVEACPHHHLHFSMREERKTLSL
jgi:ferredoxin